VLRHSQGRVDEGIALIRRSLDVQPGQPGAWNNLGNILLLEGDLDAALPARLAGRVAVLVANVPYVPTAAIATMPAEARLHEARVALDGGLDGLVVVRRVAALAPRWLAPGGSVLVETTADQAPVAAEALARNGLAASEVSDDELGATVVGGNRPV